MNLNSVIGLVRAHNQEYRDHPETMAYLEERLSWIQHKLFDIGGLLATPPGQEFANMPRIADEDITYLENDIDECQKELAPLKEFLLPGGGKVPGYLHLARTVCRRSERACVTLNREEPIHPNIMKYLNRLSDALFVFARWVAHRVGESEILWQRNIADRR